MTTGMTEEQIYEEAKKRVGEKKGFYGNLITYVVVNIICFLVWAFTTLGGYPWFLWVLGPWGVFVLLHYFRVFVLERKGDRAAIEKEAERIKREQG